MVENTEVHGTHAPGFGRVRDVFAKNFARGLETGAALSVYVGDELVADLWGGVADHRTGRAWTRDTPCFAFSCTKAMTAAAALRVAEHRGYDLTAPVSSWWPEFGARGKERVTGEHLLSHQSGLPAFARDVSVAQAADPKAMADLLADQAPEWEPGTGHGYHTYTFGWLAGEMVRRMDGRTVGRYVSEEIADPLGLDLWVGAPDTVVERTARLTSGSGASGSEQQAPSSGTGAATHGKPPEESGSAAARLAEAAGDPLSALSRSMRSPDVNGVTGRFNNRDVLAAGWPAAGLVTTAHGLAGFYRNLLAGRILEPDTLRNAITPRVNGPDNVLCMDSSFGLGFMRPSLVFAVPRAAQGGAFGHTGFGGSIGLADIERGISLGYVMNRTGAEMSGGLRAMRLVKAVYDSVGKSED
ncbi:CubicO group peptidase (beta-lactamase class C family) [Haloactinospora alba]|uniref:CubicO group peptidase (Beta-lactamase class C family) n=1 Tax=Haloactinospora alba TaxID=405555 RepID=A0A543NKS9_9ACTN|nr:serine hydrolase domain-containing protein [Haloactinospora alba]TQN32458.1 CubicO group peptidase (beta-lactamase class C family) [Haloactinospora alba]